MSNKELQSKIQKMKWEQFWGRKTNVQIASSFVRGIGSNKFIRVFGSCLHHQVTYFNGKTVYGYAVEKEMQRFLENIRKKFSTDLNFAKNFPARNNRAVRSAVDKVQGLSKKALKSNIKQLIRIYKDFLKIENELYFYGWLNFLWDKFLVDLVQEELGKICNNKKEVIKYLEIFSVPGYPPPIIQEQLSLLTIASRGAELSSKTLKKLLENHAQKFGWMAVYNFGEELFSVDYYQKNLKELLNQKINFKQKIKRIKASFKKNELDFQKAINKFKKYKKLFILANLLHQAPNMRDEREEYRDKMVFYGTNIYKAISKKLKIPLSLIVNCTNNEIINGLKNKNIDNISEIKLRNKKYLIYFDNDEIEILPSNLINSIVDKVESKNSKIKFLKGSVARKGIVKGRIKIVLSTDDLNKIKRGDVFITTMTKPNFISAIKKASAIITDEGSILCHAAIISREMNKPCIIGTKIATKVLKDGQFVEVDANRGIVKIL